MSDLPSPPTKLIGRRVRTSRKADHLAVTFRYMPPITRKLLSFSLRCLRLLMVLCLISDLIGAYLVASQSYASQHNGFLAEKYLGPVYSLFSFVTDFYARLLVDWVGIPNIVYIVMPIAAVASIITWTQVINIADRIDILPRMLAPFLSQRKKLRFYPDRVKIGLRSVPFDPEASAFRLDRPKRLREGKQVSRDYYGQQEIFYDVGAAKYSVAIFWNADHAANTQNSLSVILQWWKANCEAFKASEPLKQSQANQDVSLD